MKEKEVNKEIFEIKNSEINISDLMAEIESNLKRRAIDKTEIERISKLKISAKTPAGHRPFDPSHTANLFEKGIAPPRFSNPKYWFIKGPLKWIIHKFTDFYSIVDKKLSENRIKAFYSVIYELILLRSRYEKLEKKFDELYNLVLNSEKEKDVYANGIFFENNELLADTFSKSNTLLAEMLSSTGKILILNPDKDNFLNLLRWKKINFEVVTDSPEQFDYIKKEITQNIQLVSSIPSLKDFKNYSSIILHSNVCLLSPKFLEKIILNIRNNAEPKTQILFRFSNHAIKSFSPFRETFPTCIELENVDSYFKELGFQNIQHHNVGADEYQVISFFVK